MSRTDGRLAGGRSGADARVPGGGAGTVGNLQRKLKEVEADIREDKLGQKEYEDTLDRLQRRRADLQKRVEENEDYISGFEQDMKPFLQKYEALVADKGEEPLLPALDFTQRQLFWLSGGSVWCAVYRPAALKNQASRFYF